LHEFPSRRTLSVRIAIGRLWSHDRSRIWNSTHVHSQQHMYRHSLVNLCHMITQKAYTVHVTYIEYNVHEQGHTLALGQLVTKGTMLISV
jgi:hypothetical protein